jgi:hypothetical protein
MEGFVGVDSLPLKYPHREMKKESAAPKLGGKEKKTMKKLTFIFVAFAFALSACGIALPEMVTGSGKMTTQTFGVRNFDQIRVGTSGVLYIEQGDTFRVTVETDDNILPLLKVEVQQGVLMLGLKKPATILQRETLIYRVTLPALSALDVSGSAETRVEDFTAESLNVNVSGSGDVMFVNLAAPSLAARVSGSGNVIVENLTADSVTCELSGSGEVRLSGTADSLSVRISGSGDALLENLKTSGAQVSVNGTGDALVWALDSLDVTISGSGKVQYAGSPRLTQTISGSGELVALGEK